MILQFPSKKKTYPHDYLYNSVCCDFIQIARILNNLNVYQQENE